MTQVLQAFFLEHLQHSLANEKIDLSPLAELYVRQLLQEFTIAENLSPQGNDIPTLFELYQKTFHLDSGVRFEALRHLGDVALFVGGFFNERIDESYYVQMGSSAYMNAALIFKGFHPVLSEMSIKFIKLIRVLSRISKLMIKR